MPYFYPFVNISVCLNLVERNGLILAGLVLGGLVSLREGTESTLHGELLNIGSILWIQTKNANFHLINNLAF